MIESILLVAVGFLGAILLTLLAAPVLWRRAVTLTRRRVEASIPMSRSEIQADKDRLRADFAMNVRRLEVNLDRSKEKAIAQRIEIDRLRDQLRELTTERTALEERIAASAAEADERETELHRRNEELETAAERLEAVHVRLDEKTRELEEMSQMYEEASYASSTRQIELVARESEIDRLSDEISGLRKERKEAERRVREAEAARKESDEALDSERRRTEELDAKLSRLMTTVSDREEKLERREKEIARLQQDMKAQSERTDDLAGKLEAAQAANAYLEEALERSAADIAALERHEKEVVRLQRDLLDQTRKADGLEVQLAALQLAEDAGADAPQPATNGVSSAMQEETNAADQARLESRIAALARENGRLRERAGTLLSLLDGKTRDGDALLRDQINELAAQVVQLTALVDGPESPLRDQLANGGGDSGADGMPANSLADRVRALQKAAESRVN